LEAKKNEKRVRSRVKSGKPEKTRYIVSTHFIRVHTDLHGVSSSFSISRGEMVNRIRCVVLISKFHSQFESLG